jgi:D-alanine-D-alanine ligase-like ATP-grasp enzyme
LIMIAIVAAAKRKLMNKKGTYELLGCDILVGDDLQPYLLEVNTNPAMFTDTQVQKELLPKLMRNTLGLVLDLFENENS